MDSTSVSLLRRLHDPLEESAWERFIELYTPVMFYWAKQRGLNLVDSADLVQDVLLTLVQKINDYDPSVPGRFRGWLRTITLNRATDFQRRRIHHQSVVDTQLLEIAEPSDREFWEENEYRRQLIARAFQLLQANFEPSTWQAGYSQLVEGQTAREVAQRLGITINAAYIAKSRMLERLRVELDGLLD